MSYKRLLPVVLLFAFLMFSLSPSAMPGLSAGPAFVGASITLPDIFNTFNEMKIVFAGILGLFNSGWYAILRGNLYTAMPGQSGTVMAVGMVTGMVGKLIPFGIGLAAERFGLGPAMWILLAGPVALLFGLPRKYDQHPVELNG